jgi:hypothetical protein
MEDKIWIQTNISRDGVNFFSLLSCKYFKYLFLVWKRKVFFGDLEGCLGRKMWKGNINCSFGENVINISREARWRFFGASLLGYIFQTFCLSCGQRLLWNISIYSEICVLREMFVRNGDNYWAVLLFLVNSYLYDEQVSASHFILFFSANCPDQNLI